MLDGRDFYLLELNGRIQVEHPVTELVTGRRHRREQLRIAAGEPSQRAVTSFEGHAVEVRLYAEDPRTFLPQAGRIERLRLPTGIRVDAGVEEGDEVGVAYDPMIAKLIAHGPTRDEALLRLRDALAETAVEGLTTNLPFLRWLVAHPVVRAGRTTTAFLSEYPPLSAPPARLPSGPWDGAWRLNLPPPEPHAPPDVDEPRMPGRRRGRRAERADRADAGHGDQGARSAGRQGRAPADAPRPRGDEDGDAGRLALRRRRCARSTSPRATRSPAGRSSSSSRSSYGVAQYTNVRPSADHDQRPRAGAGREVRVDRGGPACPARDRPPMPTVPARTTSTGSKP